MNLVYLFKEKKRIYFKRKNIKWHRCNIATLACDIKKKFFLQPYVWNMGKNSSFPYFRLVVILCPKNLTITIDKSARDVNDKIKYGEMFFDNENKPLKLGYIDWVKMLNDISSYFSGCSKRPVIKIQWWLESFCHEKRLELAFLFTFFSFHKQNDNQKRFASHNKCDLIKPKRFTTQKQSFHWKCSSRKYSSLYFLFHGVVFSVMVIILGNEISDRSSTPRRSCLRFT